MQLYVTFYCTAENNWWDKKKIALCSPRLEASKCTVCNELKEELANDDFALVCCLRWAVREQKKLYVVVVDM